MQRWTPCSAPANSGPTPDPWPPADAVCGGIGAARLRRGVSAPKLGWPREAGGEQARELVRRASWTLGRSQRRLRGWVLAVTGCVRGRVATVAAKPDGGHVTTHAPSDPRGQWAGTVQPDPASPICDFRPLSPCDVCRTLVRGAVGPLQVVSEIRVVPANGVSTSWDLGWRDASGRDDDLREDPTWVPMTKVSGRV